MRKSFFLCIFFLLFTSLVYAQETLILDDATKETGNRFILNIAKEILTNKDRYSELTDFDENALVKNQYGIYAIDYKKVDSRIKNTNNSYEFLVAITRLEDRLFKKPGFESRHYEFPVLGLRVSIFVQRQVLWHHFNINRIIDKNMDLLYQHQGKYLPIQMTLKSNKDKFQVGERIEFQVVLENKTNANFKIKNLNEDTLFFTINQKIWGTKSMEAAKAENKKIVLGPYETYQRGFKGESFSVPGEVEIDCTYNLAYKGIMPFGKLKITIE